METIRQQMIALLIDREMDARELSQTVGICSLCSSSEEEAHNPTC